MEPQSVWVYKAAFNMCLQGKLSVLVVLERTKQYVSAACLAD